jgi:hypothetical protein
MMPVTGVRTGELPRSAADGTRRPRRPFVAASLRPSAGLLIGILLLGGVVVLSQTFGSGPVVPPEEEPTSGDTPAEGRSSGVWLSRDELMGLPTGGAAWDRLLAVADEDLREETELSERDDHNVRTLAAALVGTRLDHDGYREKAMQGLRTVVSAPPGDDLLAAARRLSTYVIAADVLGLAELDGAFDRRFRSWVDDMRHHPFDHRRFGSSIVDAHEGRPNNWGTHAGASRVAAAVYLGDDVDLARAAAVFRGYLGDRDAYDGFIYGDLDWQADPARPVGINPPGASLEGRSVDGVLPDDQRRAGGFRWPPPRENYVWEALQGATVQAELLRRQGYDAWAWESQALLRAVQWLLEEADYPAEGDDRWIPWLVNAAYETSLPVEETTTGKAMGFTDWTHAGRDP